MTPSAPTLLRRCVVRRCRVVAECPAAPDGDGAVVTCPVCGWRWCVLVADEELGRLGDDFFR